MIDTDFPGMKLMQAASLEELPAINAGILEIARETQNSMDESPLIPGLGLVALSGSPAIANALSWQNAGATQQSSGVLTLPDLEAALVSLWNAPMASPDYFFISPATKRRLLHLQRIARLYEVVMPRTRRKLRTCIERRVQARLAQGRRRIARIEQRELREERKVLEAL